MPTVSSSVDKSPNKDLAAARLAALQQLTQRQLELIGENPSREGLRDTPARVAMAFSQLTCGYNLDVQEVVGGAIFEEEHRGMVLVRDIEMYSLCEHHLLPMFGRVHVAYVPDGRVIGLSKLPRLVEVFARRLQLQERLTQQIADAVEEILQPRGVAVLIDAVHLCMMMRGIEKRSSSTATMSFRGTFLDDYGTREEFYRLVRGRRG
jgi:GTP cyclohydrolase I